MKQSDEALARASERSKEFAHTRLNLLSVIAPEFRRPLATILSSLELLHKQGKRLSEKKRNQLYHTIQNLVFYLNDTIQDARNLKELGADQRLRLESFELLAFTQQIIGDMEVIADGQKLSWR